MNELHPNDKKNISKHKKMLRRLADGIAGAAHPRSKLPESTQSFRITDRIAITGPSVKPDDKWILKAHSVIRNNNWVDA